MASVTVRTEACEVQPKGCGKAIGGEKLGEKQRDRKADGRVPPMVPGRGKGSRAPRAADLGCGRRQGPRPRPDTRRVRRSRAPSAGRAVPAGIWLDLRSSDSAGLFLQQFTSDRADQGFGDDSHRDGARRADRSNECRSICRKPSGCGWADWWATGKATRWWWTLTNFTDKTRFRGSTAKTCT